MYQISRGSTIKVKVDFTPGFDPSKLSLDAASAAKGMTYSANDQTITWTPTSAQAGSHTVSISISPMNPTTIPLSFVIVVIDPVISGTDLQQYQPGAALVISGSNLTSTESNPAVTIGGMPAAINSFASGQITAMVPDNAEAGQTSVRVILGEAQSNAYTVSIVPVIGSIFGDARAQQGVLAANKGYGIAGKGFGSSLSEISVTVGGIAAKVSAVTPTSVMFTVPIQAHGKVPIVVERRSIKSMPFLVKVYNPGVLNALNLVLD
jgi:hypothetical protein